MNQPPKLSQDIRSLRPMPAVRYLPQQRAFNAYIKRAFDICASLVLLLVTAPLFAVIGLLVALDGGPIIYRHVRVGKDITPFDCLKFRTMMLDADGCLQEYLSYHPQAKAEWVRDQKLLFDPRITPTGKFLRATSLDELPQLINVLRGDMSLVGPRPVTSAELSHYNRHVSEYASVLPGITGLWQVSGRNDLSYERRVELDCEYVLQHTLFMDFKILMRTVGVLLSRKGAR
ncbi:sugar transferase [Agrobacterium sp. SHOUNA12C]|uniref:Exopolysaccharide production protein n=2 Tax=Rhizobium rhizogenes TaxID=359 RepID=B9JNF5_RHIR8|nr:sugar transferase [Rhizobium rhizogenes]ACM29086.1 exopolysaccharide production protein [Rhizobium rhizogenes K84]MCJ9719259.1 sugar transferase [Agrobacterium sp. BETTINA12B]MCJ9756005.1 sugar transferase [Agrobacterium sp. SHOUNA12C]MDJ1634310.1 sugar transferase [Rhizobium rhizogenes]NTF57519.1 sugar transferase [Rhizobium rhizogenes]